MSPLFRIPLGIIVIIVGYLIVAKTETIFSWFGQNAFAEKVFGFGGTRLFYKLIGIGIIFIGMFIVTNLISDMLIGIARILTHTKS